jgi:hypothetical protein
MYFHADFILFRGALNLVIQRSAVKQREVGLYIVFLPRNLELVWPCIDQLEDVSESLNKHFQRYCEFHIVPNGDVKLQRGSKVLKSKVLNCSARLVWVLIT